MVDLNRIVGTLQATRRELTQQLDAIDKAIAALVSAAPSAEPAAVPAAPPTDIPAEVPATEQTDAPSPPEAMRLKPKRVLNDAHKEALARGRRRAREVKEATAGRARERPDDSFVPALAPMSGAQPPRLIKKHQDVA